MNHRSFLTPFFIIFTCSSFANYKNNLDSNDLLPERENTEYRLNQLNKYLPIDFELLSNKEQNPCLLITRHTQDSKGYSAKIIDVIIDVIIGGGCTTGIGQIIIGVGKHVVAPLTIAIIGIHNHKEKSFEIKPGGGDDNSDDDNNNKKDKNPKNKQKLAKQKEESKKDNNNKDPKKPDKEQQKIDPKSHLEDDKYRPKYTGNRIYEPNPKHHPNSPGGIGVPPDNGYVGVQEAIKVPKKDFLVGVENGKIVQYNQHAPNTYHGYIVEDFHKLDPAAQEALVESGLFRSIKSGKLR